MKLYKVKFINQNDNDSYHRVALVPAETGEDAWNKFNDLNFARNIIIIDIEVLEDI